jgi:hypothetical protein
LAKTEKSLNRRFARISPIQPDCRFKFKKRSQPVTRTYNETLSVVAMRVCNEDRDDLGPGLAGAMKRAT